MGDLMSTLLLCFFGIHRWLKVHIDSIKVVKRKMGVWNVSYVAPSGISSIRQIVNAAPLSCRLFTDVYKTNERLCIAYMCWKVFAGIEPAITVYFEHCFLQSIEEAITTTGKVASANILRAVFGRLFCYGILGVLRVYGNQVAPTLKNGVVLHFDTLVLKAKLEMDSKAARDPRNKLDFSGEAGWNSFNGIADFILRDLVNIAANFLLVLRSAQPAGASYQFFALCIAGPLMNMLAESSLYDFVFIYYSRNQAYLRVRAILHMMNDPAQLIEHGLGPYVLEEYQNARKAVGSLSDEHPYVQAFENPDPFLTFFARVGSDLPMLYGTYLVLTEPSSISVAQFSIMQRSASVLSTSITEIISSASAFRDRCHAIKELYRAEISVGVMKDGAVAYPDPTCEGTGGMAIEVRNLCFSYPEAATTAPTLQDISFSITPGQLVAIVGANGSGKSTILKLLTRVYDPDTASGLDSILVDGRPISEYRLADLRRATTMLTQDHELYPLSLRENIGLGYVEKHNDSALLQRAIEMGGASHCVEKLKDGMETKMDEESYSDKWDVPADEEHPLNVELAGLPTAPKLSGGEKQRIVASRAFMRFMSGRTRLVAVDEPTSAFDAAGEQALFDNLLSMREGKTMIVVTHRFGTLTRQADFIICMKDGTIKERGSHKELMKLDGEYANLYNIQARAFVDEEKEEERKVGC